MSLSFLTPAAALVSIVVLVPLVAAWRGGKLSARVRSVLALPPPSRGAAVTYIALATLVACLGLAAAQPVLTRTSAVQVRTDAQVLFVLDVSQSMAASKTPGSPTRLERARDAARGLRTSIPEVEAGVATLTDRVLPDLLPVPGHASFGATLTQSVQIEEPPPLEAAVRATSFAALDDVVRGNYFASGASKRVVVLLTDGETRPFDETRVARALRQHGIAFEAVRIGGARESLYDAAGKPDPAYVPDNDAGQALASLAAASGGKALDESEVGDAASFLRSELGDGPTRQIGSQREDEILLAPFLAALALVPLGLLVLSRSGVGVPLVHAVRRLV